MIWTIVVAGSAALLVLACGGLLTNIGPWYRNLRKPAWQPPDWAFGPAWTIIMTLVAVAGVLGWRAARGTQEHTLLIVLFLINGMLHVSWSLLFFRLQRPDWALAEVVLFWLSIVAIIVALWPVSHGAVLAMMPYIGWVSFAAFLNLTIVRLNPRKARGSAPGPR
jgi:tryptophan-rich sensory protein